MHDIYLNLQLNSLVVTCWERDPPIGSLVCGVFVCFVNFLCGVLGPVSGVVLDCIDS